MIGNDARQPLPGQTPSPKRLAAVAQFLLSSRRRRDTALSTVEFGEPAWDMLLDLYVQHAAGRRVSVIDLCEAAAVPATTALRWMNVMVGASQLIRQPDAADRRRVFVSLAPALLAAIETYLDRELQLLGPLIRQFGIAV